jgi:hypothetical protein
MLLEEFTVPLGPGQATVCEAVREGNDLVLTLRYRSADLVLPPERFVISQAADRQRLCAWAEVRMSAVVAFLAAVQGHLTRTQERERAEERALAAFLSGGKLPPPPPPVAWPAPLPLTAQTSLPPFPVGALPPVLAEMVTAVSTATQTPPDLAGLLALASVAAAVGKTAVVQAREGWVEPLAFWALVALPSGNRKSAVYRELTTPLTTWEHDQALAARETIALAASERRQLEVTLAQAEQAAARAATTERDVLVAARENAARAVARHQTPAPPLLSVADTTPEALAQALLTPGGALAVLAPEGGLFETLAGRYSNGIPNLDLFLCGYSGEDYRRTRGAQTDIIRQATLTLALTVQPDVLRGLAHQPGFRGRGLLARFWYALPASFVGQRQADPPPVPAAVRDAYAARITALLGLRPPVDARAPAPHALTLAPDAAAHLIAWTAEIEGMLGEFEPLGPIADWGMKLAGTTVRVAALLHLVHDGAAGLARPISEPTIARAVTLARWAISHALAAHDAMGQDDRLEGAGYLLRAVERLVARQGGLARISRRSLYQVSRSRFSSPRALDTPLALLVEHGYLRRFAPPDGAQPGRPSEVYEVNPALASGTSSHA